MRMKMRIKYFRCNNNVIRILNNLIVSCCGSPTEKLAWLVTHILTPLFSHVPTHLRSTHEHLERLSSLNPVVLDNMKFCSADISALYTNLNIEACIDDIMAMASEYKHSLSLLGLKLVDLHRILDWATHISRTIENCTYSWWDCSWVVKYHPFWLSSQCILSKSVFFTWISITYQYPTVVM